MHQERDPPTASQLLTQIQDLQNKVNSLSDTRDFHDPAAASSSGATRVPSQPSIIPSPRTMPCRDSGWPHDTRDVVGTSGNVFESLPARKGPSSAFFKDSRNWASSSRRLRLDTTGNSLRLDRELIREPQNSSTLVPRFQSGDGLLNHTGGTYSHNGTIDYLRFPTSELHLGKVPDSMECQSWKVSIKTEVCSIDELMTSRSMVGRNDCPDYDMLGAMIASA